MSDGEAGVDPVGVSTAQDEYRLLSVIVPVFNERSTVAEVIRRIRAVELPFDIEVIVVDDGSSDGTDKVEEYSRFVTSDRKRLPIQWSGSMFLRSPVKRLP